MKQHIIKPLVKRVGSSDPPKWVAVNKYIYKLIKQIIRVDVLYESTCLRDLTALTGSKYMHPAKMNALFSVASH